MVDEPKKPATRRKASPRKTTSGAGRGRGKRSGGAAAGDNAAGAAAKPASASTSAEDQVGTAEPVTLAEPAASEQPSAGAAEADSPLDRVPWKRGAVMLAFLVLIWVGQWVLGLATVVQFLWMAVTGEKNRNIASFGEGLGDWLNRAARFQTGATEEKPFPWRRWGA